MELLITASKPVSHKCHCTHDDSMYFELDLKTHLLLYNGTEYLDDSPEVTPLFIHCCHESALVSS